MFTAYAIPVGRKATVMVKTFKFLLRQVYNCLAWIAKMVNNNFFASSTLCVCVCMVYFARRELNQFMRLYYYLVAGLLFSVHLFVVGLFGITPIPFS